eukprot:1372152-Lingulodinium_polyedra.AAC.1
MWRLGRHGTQPSTTRRVTQSGGSTLHQKLNSATARFKKVGWSKVSSSLLELYGPSKKATAGRWVRAARGISAE